jgi:DedD protein
MRLREENRIKDKMEFHLDTRHVFYLVGWSIVLSGAIFATGLFVGQKKQAGVAGYTVEQAMNLKEKKNKDQLAGVDPLAASFTFLTTLSHHPEQHELKDAVLNAMARLRIETLRKVKAQDAILKAELAEELFGSERREKPVDPRELLSATQGVQAQIRQREQRLAEAPANLDSPQQPPVVEPAPVVEPKPAKIAVLQPAVVNADSDLDDELGASFAIQAKAFRSPDDAKIFIGYIKRELRRSRYKPFIMPVELPGKGKWYRVRIGKFGSRLEAEKFKHQFERKLGLETFLVKL